MLLLVDPSVVMIKIGFDLKPFAIEGMIDNFIMITKKQLRYLFRLVRRFSTYRYNAEAANTIFQNFHEGRKIIFISILNGLILFLRRVLLWCSFYQKLSFPSQLLFLILPILCH